MAMPSPIDSTLLVAIVSFRTIILLLKIDNFMVEPLLSGIVLGLVPVTITGLFVTAYLQYRRGDRVTSSL